MSGPESDHECGGCLRLLWVCGCSLKIANSVSVAEQQILREKSSVECRVQECEGLSRERERVTASAVRESTGNHRCKATPKPVL